MAGVNEAGVGGRGVEDERWRRDGNGDAGGKESASDAVVREPKQEARRRR